MYQTHSPIKNELKMKSYILDVLEGLNYIHSKGITIVLEIHIYFFLLGYVHLDIKLANLYCIKNDEGVRRVKVGDFGLCHKID